MRREKAPVAMTPEQMAEIIRSCGYMMQIKSYDRRKDGRITTYVYAVCVQNGRGDARKLGEIDMVARIGEQALRSKVVEVFSRRGVRESL